MTTTATGNREASTTEIGIIGNRHLIAVQTFDISRLTTHPVPLVPSAFVAVSGQGPKGDSNGSGKTSFLAAVSLLLGDAQWRLEANGSQAAPQLLFSPASAGLPTDLYSPAEYGYIIGVFADADRPEETALTVWLRISATPQHLKVRWTEGLHVATAETDAERYEQADQLWQALPRDHEIGPKTMRQVLYGSAPKGIAYVDTSMRRSAPSLLSQQMTEMSPEQIGTALIELTGRQGLLETEEEQRSLLAAQQEELNAQRVQDQVNRITEDLQLAGVRHRDQARQHLKDGEHLWRLHFARGYLEVLDVDDRLRVEVEDLEADVTEATATVQQARHDLAGLRERTDLKEAEHRAEKKAQQAAQRLRDAENAAAALTHQARGLNEQKSGLARIAGQWKRTPLPDARDAVQVATSTHEQARWALQSARAVLAEAEDALTAAQAGTGGAADPVLGRLRDTGVDARLLLDEITLAETARTEWEPRLWVHRDAVVVAAADQAAALAAVDGLPGATLVVADGPLTQAASGLPAGVAATVPVTGFLTGLAARTTHASAPDRAVDEALGQHTLGSFREQIAGRAARVATAQQRVAEAQQRVAKAEREEQQAKNLLDVAAEELEAAQAAARISEIDQAAAALQQQIGDLGVQVRDFDEANQEATDAWVTARANAQAHNEQVRLAEQKVRAEETALTGLSGKLREKTDARGNLRLDYWVSNWGDTPDAARALLDAQDEPVRSMRRRSLQNRSAEALKDALNAFVTDMDRADIPPALAEAMSRRQALADEDQPGYGRDTVSFESVAGPLRDLLDAASESDEILESRIRRAQAERSVRIQEVEETTAAKEREWDNVQDMVSARVEAALRKISTSLDRLNRARGGFGAQLKIVETRPSSPTSTWKWEVIPQWRRSSSGSMVDYKKVANGAQVKVFAIQLVLAALLADDGARGRVLIIDELGNSLGDVHRQDVLKDLNEVAADQDVTILGTCQDSVIGDAAGVCGEILWFSHANEADAYNQPARMWGYDSAGARVRLTQDWLTGGRNLF